MDLVQELSSPSEPGSSPLPRPMSVTSSDDPDRARTKRDQPLPDPPRDDLNRTASVASLDELGRPKPKQSQPLPDLPHENLERVSSVASLDELGRPKPRRTQPLPEPPTLDIAQRDASPPSTDRPNKDKPDKDDGVDDEEEDPYDYAIVPQGEDNGAPAGNDNQPEVPPDSSRPGSYAKVTRHSDPPTGAGDSDNPYAKVRDFGGRNRSATDPVSPRSVSPLPRTMTGSNSNLPLPLPPREAMGDDDDDVDDTYDSIDKKPEVFDDEDNGMYESVPEDLKEGLGITSSVPIPVPPRSPRPMENTSLSPVKKAEFSLSSSPANKKGTKRDKKKGANSDNTLLPVSDDHQKKSFQLFGRKRSSSTNTAAPTASKGKGKKQNSPEHVFRILTGPPPGMEDSSNNQEPALSSNNPRDSPDRFAEAKKKSSSLPRELHTSNRTSMYNPHINEPLPEVPEESGSGSGAAVMVKRDRVPDMADPSYDIVVTALSRKDKNDDDEDEQDDNYDTVESLKQSRPSASARPPMSSSKSSNPPAMPVPLPPASQSVGDAEYATVDPSVIERKRAASMTSKKQQNESERPYDRVRTIEQFKSRSFDDADEPHEYAQVNMVQKKIGRMNKQSSHPPSSPDVEPSSPPPVPPIGYLDNRPESQSPPVPEQMLPLTDDEPPYSKVNRQGNDKNSNVEDDTQREYEDIDDLLPTRRSKPPSLPAPRHSSTSHESPSSGETTLPSPRATDTSPPHDSLEQQQPVYDTLEPLVVTEI